MKRRSSRAVIGFAVAFLLTSCQEVEPTLGAEDFEALRRFVDNPDHKSQGSFESEVENLFEGVPEPQSTEPGLTSSMRGPIRASMNYLVAYGYMTGDQTEPRAWAEALRRFRLQRNLPEVVELDGATVAEMLLQRCGLAFKAQEDRCSAPRRSLSYWFDSDLKASGLETGDARAAILAAFNTWKVEGGCGFDFGEARTRSEADILIDFVSAMDQDYRFKTIDIAHADYPGICAVRPRPTAARPIHFLAFERAGRRDRWGTSGARDVIDLQSSALHEIGHCLGLVHENATVMQEQLEAGVLRHSLTARDKELLKELYP